MRVWLTDVDMHHYNKEDKPKLIHVGLELVKVLSTDIVGYTP